MKKIALLGLLIIGSGTVGAQTEKRIKKNDKKLVRKEVKMEVIDGEKTLTVSTTKGNKTSSKVYKGAEANKKLQEMEGSMKSDKVIEDIRVSGENHEKVVRITRNENGKVTEEVYKGKEADKKLKELQMNDSKKSMHKEEQRIEIKKEVHKE